MEEGLIEKLNSAKEMANSGYCDDKLRGTIIEFCPYIWDKDCPEICDYASKRSLDKLGCYSGQERPK
jgi:hypothetical protein